MCSLIAPANRKVDRDTDEKTASYKKLTAGAGISYDFICFFASFLDALASLDSKLSVSQSVIDVFRLAHLRVFQSYVPSKSIHDFE